MTKQCGLPSTILAQRHRSQEFSIKHVLRSIRIFLFPTMLRDTLGAVLVVAAAVLAAPTSPGECKALSSLSFANQPTVADGLSTRVIYNGLTRPRGLRLDALENLLVIDRGTGLIALSYRNDSTCNGWERRVVVANAELNHGIEIGPGGGDNQFLYASTSDSVYRWEYDPGSVAVVGAPVTVAWNMSNAGESERENNVEQSSNGSMKIILPELCCCNLRMEVYRSTSL